MDWQLFHKSLLFIQSGVSLVGILIILSGVLLAAYQYLFYLSTGQLATEGGTINAIRLHFGRILILGLEFIVASDLIGTTTTPDYYSLGLAAIIVVIRTLLSISLSREIATLSQGNK